MKIEIPKIEDIRGNLSVIEKDVIPFEIKRVFYLYDVPCDVERGGHAHIKQQFLLIALSGSLNVVLFDGKNKSTVFLDKPNQGLLIREGIWSEINNFSKGSVCLSISSDYFEEEDYIRKYDDFLKFKK